MRNNEKLLYDILLRMNARLESLEPYLCVLDLLEDKPVTGECPENVKDCEDCISQWLNKEADK